MNRWKIFRAGLNGHRRLAAGFAAIALALAILLIAWTARGPAESRAVSVPLQYRSPERDAEVARFVRREIEPLLATASGRDRAAVDRATAALHEHFQTFHKGVEPFVEDVTSWGTRFNVIGRSTRDAWSSWWRGPASADSVRNYITGKFQDKVVSEASLGDAVTRVVADFQNDLIANRNELFVEIRAALRAGDAPIEMRSINMGLFERELNRHAAALISGMGGNTITAGAAAFTGSVVAEEIARRVALQVIARVGTHLATETVATGAATAGGAATGGAGGTLAGPAGTVIGFGVGIAVGVAIDWWMTERFQDRLAGECHLFLDRVERSLVEGDEDSGDRGGLRGVLARTVKRNERTQRAAILARVAEVQP